MKIALVIWDLSVSGGAQRQALELAYQLQRQKHAVTVYAYTFDPEACYPELTKKLNIQSISATLPVAKGYNPKNWFSKFKFEFHGQFHPIDEYEQQLAGFISQEYDVVNIHDYHVGQVAIHYKKRYPNSKIVWMINDMPNTFQLRRNLRPKLRKNLFIFAQQLLLRLVVEWNARKESRELFGSIDAIVALGKKNQRWIKKYMGLSSIALASGLDAKKFKPQYRKTNQDFTLLAVGILFPERRYEVLISALGRLKTDGHNVRLKLVGTDKYSPAYGASLRELADKLDLASNVQFLGKVSDKELINLYRESDAFILTSETQTWGLAPFEAMASGTPVIINEQAGASDWLEPNKTALFIPPHNAEAVITQIKRLIEDPSLRESLAKDGRKYVEQHISWQQYTENMLRVFRDA